MAEIKLAFSCPEFSKQSVICFLFSEQSIICFLMHINDLGASAKFVLHCFNAYISFFSPCPPPSLSKTLFLTKFLHYRSPFHLLLPPSPPRSITCRSSCISVCILPLFPRFTHWTQISFLASRIGRKIQLPFQFRFSKHTSGS